MSAELVCSCSRSGCGKSVAVLRRRGRLWRLEFGGARRRQATDDHGVRWVRQPSESVEIPADLKALSARSDSESWVLSTHCPGCGHPAFIRPLKPEFIDAFDGARRKKERVGIKASPE